MARTANGDVILLSIYPEYAKAILRGVKKVEFRKPSVCTSASHVLIYATSPCMQVLGFFEIKQVHCLSPRRLWQKFGRVGVISQHDFFEYFEGHSEAVGLEVGQVWKFERPLPLHAVRPGLKPPQAFTYIPSAAWERLRQQSVCTVGDEIDQY
jgi:predicted transcriptional regulator